MMSPPDCSVVIAFDDRGEPAFAADHRREGTRSMDVEDHDGQTIFARQADRRGIHHPKLVRQHVLIGQLLVALAHPEPCGGSAE